MCAIFVMRDGEPVEMDERPFGKEKDLHELLEKDPELLSAEVPRDERRRWLLVKSEMGVPDREGGPDHFSLDLLLVDQDARPTFVEVKRAKNREIRRLVVGQMLDYAANASAYWTAEDLRDSFRSNYDGAKSADSELVKFTEGEYEPDEFWDAVAANLQERNLRLIFAAERIPRELRSLVEFLNEQLPHTEVIAVELTRYIDRGDGRVYVAPRIIGNTEMARRAKWPGREPRRSPVTEQQFYELMRARYEPELAERVLALYEHARADGSKYTFGRGKSPETNVWMGKHGDPDDNPLVLTFYASGGIGVNMALFREDREPDEMERLVDLLRGLNGTAEALDDAVAKGYRSFCTLYPDQVLATKDDLEAFKRVLDKATQRSAPAD